MGQQILGSDTILRMNDFTLLGLVQSVDWAPNFNATDIFELGSESRVASTLELETSGSIELNAIGGLAGLLARAIPKRNASGAFTGYEYAPTTSTGRNAYTFTQNSLKEAQFDLSLHEKTDQTNFDRSLVLPRCFITSVTGRAEAGGPASQTLAFGGDFVVGLPSPYHDVRCLPATIGTGGDAGKLILSDATVTSSNHTLLYAYVEEKRLKTTTTDPAYAALDASGGKVTVTGLNLTADYPKAICRVVVYKTTPSTTFPSIPAALTGAVDSAAAGSLTDTGAFTGLTLASYNVRITAGLGVGQVRRIVSHTDDTLTISPNWSTTPDATSKYSVYIRDTSQFAILGYQADLYLAPAVPGSPTSSEQWLKVQSVDWSVDMRSEALRQIAYNAAGTSIYCRVPTFPLNITANASVYESDWKDWKAVLNKTFPGNDKYEDSYDLSPESLKETFALVIIYKTKQGTEVERMTLTDLRVDGYGNRVNAGGRSEISWSFTGTSFTLVGANA